MGYQPIKLAEHSIICDLELSHGFFLGISTNTHHKKHDIKHINQEKYPLAIVKMGFPPLNMGYHGISTYLQMFLSH